MTSSRFDLGSTSKTLNLSLLRFNERSGSENLACGVWEDKDYGSSLQKRVSHAYNLDYVTVEFLSYKKII